MRWTTPRMTGLIFQTGVCTLGAKSALDQLCCLLHLPRKAWIAARWALRAPYKIPDYLKVKDSRETVLPRTSSLHWGCLHWIPLPMRDLQSPERGFLLQIRTPGPARACLCPWYSARQWCPRWCRDMGSGLPPWRYVGNSGSHGAKPLVDTWSR